MEIEMEIDMGMEMEMEIKVKSCLGIPNTAIDNRQNNTTTNITTSTTNRQTFTAKMASGYNLEPQTKYVPPPSNSIPCPLLPPPPANQSPKVQR